MGEPALDVPERARVPALRPARVDAGRAAALHADDLRARHARHRRVPRRAACEDGVLERLQAARPVVGGASPVLRRLAAPAALLAVLVAYYVWHELAAGGFSSSGGTSPGSRSSLVPAVFVLVYFALPFRSWTVAACRAGLGLPRGGLPARSGSTPASSANFAKLGAMTALGFWFVSFFEAVSWVVARRGDLPGSTPTRCGAGRRTHIVEQPAAGLHDALVRVPDAGQLPPGSASPARPPRPVLLRALPRRRATASACARG